MKPQRTLPILLSLFFPLFAFAATETVNGITWTYTVSNGEASVGGGSSSSTAVPTTTTGGISIPTILGDYPVTHIGYSAFSRCSGLTSVLIPESVTSIESFAFANCSGLTSITIPNSVTSIVSTAFSGCSEVKDVVFPGRFRMSTTFLSSYQMITNVAVADGVTSIGDHAFSDCSGLTSITIPDGVTSIGSYAFNGCSGLTSIAIPNSVTSIRNNAFSGCSAINDIVVPGRFKISTIFPASYKTIATAVVANGVTSIGDSTFSGCSGLTSITIPDCVTSIGYSAFSGCSRLTSITIPDSVKSIAYSAFSGCSGLTETRINVTDLGCWATNGINSELKGTRRLFVDGEEVTSIAIPDGMTSIGESAFRGCSGLTSITIPDGVTHIGSYAFSGCSGLTSITIPDGVTRIGDRAFYGCSGLTSITVPDSVTSIGGAAFFGCSGLTSITIPDGVTSIEYSAFSGCSGLTSITIPDSVTSIGNNAFEGCSGLMSITIPDSVTSIGGGAFEGCSGLTSISIPDSVTSIGHYAFNDCSSELYDTNSVFGVKLVDGWAVGSVASLSGSIDLTGIRGIAGSAFSGCSGLTSITIPDSVAIIESHAFDGCSGLTSITIPDGVTSIGESAFYNCSGLTSISISDCVTNIGNYAFYGCSELTSVTIPASVTSIGYSAFSGCSELMSLTIGENVRTIGSAAFYDCFSLTSVTIPDSVSSIGSSAFSGCSDLTSVTIQNGVTNIGDCAFSGCSGLTSITIPDGVTSIGYEAFSGCSRLRSVSIPASVEKREVLWFKGCQRIQSVVIPGWVSLESMFDYEENDNLQSITRAVVAQGSTSIAENAFYGCFELKSVTIPNTVTNIGRSAFEGCSKLTSVTIPDGVTSIGENAFLDCGVENVNISDLRAWLGISFGWGSNPCQYGGRLILNGEEITNLVIPDGMTSIGAHVFEGCSGLTSVTIPNSVTNIGEAAFSGCDGLTEVHISDLAAWCGILFGWSANPCESAHRLFLNDEEITDLVIPDSVTSIADYVFSGCSNLTSITIPDGVTSIGYETFYDCSGLTSVTVPNGVTSIGWDAFEGCSGLKEVHISDLAAWCNISFKSSFSNPCSYAHRLVLNGEEITDLVIPNNVTNFGRAFAGCSRLMSVTIPNSVSSIEREAFNGCSGLTSLMIPDSVTRIVNYAFYGCSGLATLYLPRTFKGKTSSMGIPSGCAVIFSDSLFLTVYSEFGQPSPSGTNIPCESNSVRHCSVSSHVASGSDNRVRHVCTGWTGTGSVPATGAGTNVTFTIEEDSTLTWNWRKENQISVSVSGVGSCAFGTQWVADGTTATAEIVPSTHLYAISLSGDTNGVTLAGTTLAIPSDGPRNIAVTVAEVKLSLDVATAHGTAAPSGRTEWSWGDSVSANVVADAPAAGVRHVCTGWTGTGSVPATGTGTNATFTIEEDSTLTWNWRKENRISVSVSGVGSCAFGTQWVADGTTVTAQVVPSTHLYAISLSGDTNGVTLARTTLTIPGDGPRDIAVTVAEVKLSLDVSTAHGTAAPSGHTEWSWGDSVSANVVADAPAAGVRHVCTGWTGTGSVPATGAGTNATFTIEEDSTLTWNWRKENQIAVSVSGVGSCDFGTQWIADGATATAEIVPSTHLYAITLSGDTNGVALAGTTLTIPSDGPRDIAVTVTEVKLSLAVETAHGTATPSGNTEWSWGDSVSANVTTDAPANGIRYVCTGWTGTGSVPATGTGTNATFTIEEDSTLAWTWRKENQVAVSVSGVGSCAFGTQWIADGATATAEIVPSTHLYAISLSGDTNGVTLAGTTLTIPSDGPRDISVTVNEVKLSLDVSTAHGTPTPAGATEWSWGDSVSANVATDAPANGVRHVCTGWTGTGSVPATGTGTNVTFIIEEDSTLTWNWRKENQIAVSVSGFGSCDSGTQWVEDGTTTTATIVPTTHLYSIALSGDTNGVTLAGTTLTIPSNGPRDIAVTVAEVKLSFDVFSAHGESVPEDGRTFWSWNEMVNASTSLRAEENGWRFYCIGWKGTGSVPSTGTGTNATFAIQEDSSLEWQWETEVRIECSVTGEGAADPVAEWVWCATGTKQVPFSTPAEVFGWDVSGDSDGVEVDAPSKTIVVPADKPRNVSVRVISAETAVKTGGKPVAWRPADDEPWRAAAGVSGSSDGLCLKSGKIAASGTSSVETTVSGSGSLSFDWMISAGRGDTCSFVVDGTQVNGITRSTGWATVTAELGAGPHVLQWIYRRGTGSATGEDAAFLDNVDWRPNLSLQVSSAFGTPDPETGTHTLAYGDSVAAGVAEPAPADGVRRVCTGWSGTGSVPASGTASAVSFTVTNDSSLAWNWRTDYRIAVAVLGPTTADFSEDWVESGTTKIVHWAPTVPYFATSLSGDVAGVVLDEAAGTLSVPADRARAVSFEVKELTLRNVLDEEMLDWTTDEERPWFPQIGTNADGEDAAQSSPAAGDDTSGLETVLQGAGTLSWTWKVSTDDNLGVDVLLDGEWLEAYAPGTDWSEESLDVAGSGPHVVRFEFWNAGSTADAKGWIDRVSWTGDAPFGARLRLVAAAQTEAAFSTAAFAGGSSETMRRTLEVATGETFATVAKTVELGYVTEKTVEEAAVSGLAPETSYWARLRVARAGGEERVSETVPFRTAAHVAPAPGTPVADARAVGATVSVPLEALGSDGGAVEMTVAVTVVKTGEPAGAATPATLAAPGTAQIEVSGLTRGTVYRFVATARAVATGLETSVSGGFTTDWGETPRIAAGGSGLGNLPALCFLPSESGTGEDFVIRIDNPVPGCWYPVYTNGAPAGRFAVQSCGMPTISEGGYIVRVPAVESALFVKIGVSEEYIAPGTAE